MTFPNFVSVLIKDLIISAAEIITKKPSVKRFGAEAKIILSENNPKNAISKGIVNNEIKKAIKNSKKYHGINTTPKNIKKKNNILFIIGSLYLSYEQCQAATLRADI